LLARVVKLDLRDAPAAILVRFLGLDRRIWGKPRRFTLNLAVLILGL
jgi:hypothetical protein